MEQFLRKKYASNPQEYLQKGSKFWKNQLVPQVNTPYQMIDEPIVENINLEKFKFIPNKQQDLPKNFKWINFDIKKEEDCNKIAEFLKNNYFVDERYNFCYDIKPAFLEWYYSGPYYDKELLIGVETQDTNYLVGYIGATIKKVKINKKTFVLPEVNFLCVIRKLWEKGLSTVLIKEMAQTCLKKGYTQAIYKESIYVPKPIAITKQYYRAINIKKLLDIGFTKLNGKTTLQDLERVYSLPKKTTSIFKELTESMLDICHEKLNSYLTKYNYYDIFSLEEFKQKFYNNNFVKTYVLIENDEIKDMISYLNLDYNITKEDRNIKTAYLYYYTSTNETPYILIKNLLILLKNENYDLLVGQTIMENKDILMDLNFEEGSYINYHFYNWNCKPLLEKQIGKIIL